MRQILDEIRERVYAEATLEQRNALAHDEWYGSPASWWADARGYGLVTQFEVHAARTYYGRMWNYRGD